MTRSTLSARDVAVRVLTTEADAVRRLIDHLDDQFDRAVELIAEAPGSVIVSGIGKSGLVGRKISATFSSLGTPSHFMHPTEAMHGDVGRVRREDLMFLLSHGGATEEVLALAAVVRQDRIPVISVTGNPQSHLARISDCHLNIGAVTEACPHNLAPTTSTTAQLALGDALALAVAERKNFTADDYHRSHPGGNLGRQLMHLVDVMRLKVGENLPLLTTDMTVEQVLSTTSAGGGRRVGAVLIVDDAGKLAGIFTDADLARLLVKDGAAALGQSIGKVMTANPKRLSDTALVRDAVQLAREMRLDEIPIVDADDKPVGMIDVQDLVALKVIEG
jgi:arabinose-5-phosphate isomerase